MIRKTSIALVIPFILLAGAVPVSAQTRYLRVYYIQYVPEGSSSTYGECSYYEFPGADGILGTGDDRNLLIDGARSSYTYVVLIPFLESRIGAGGTIWFMALSSAGEDHYGGLWDVADQFEVKNYYQNLRWPEGDKSGYDSLMDKLDAEGCGPNSPPGHYFEVDPGDYLSGPSCNVHPADHPCGFDPYIEDRVLAAKQTYDGGSDNKYVLVHQFRCGESVFLSGGDAPTNGPENGIMSEDLEYCYYGASYDLASTDVYKVHHHGSKYSSDQNFMDQMSPGYAVAQMGYGYGEGSHDHPTKEALDRIWSTGGIVYRNDLDGTVLIKCDNLGNFDITRSRAYVNETLTPGGSHELIYPPPALPQNLRVSAVGEDYVTLDWDDVSEAYGYDVFRSPVSNGDPGAGRDANPGCEATGIYQKINPVNVSVSYYTDSDLLPGVRYYYRVSSKKIYTQGGCQVCYERRYSNQSATTTIGSTPTPTPIGFKTATPTPSVTPTSSPSPTTTPTPSMTPTTSPTSSPSPSPSPPIYDGDVVINEILADVPYWEEGDANGDGVVSSWEDEFVELVNWTDHTVNLGGCTLWESHQSTARYAFAEPFYVPPGKAVVIFGGGAPSGEFGGATVVTVGVEFGLYLTNGGDTVTLRDGEYIYDSVTYGEEGGYDQSLNRYPEKRGPFAKHSEVTGSGGSLYSPGTRVNGSPFEYEPTPTPPPTPPPTATPTPTMTPSPTASPTPSTSPSSPATPSPTPTPKNSPTPSPPATPEYIVFPSGDYDGDGFSDPAVFRPGDGLWAIRNISRCYYGKYGDIPAPGDYDGDDVTDIAIFREISGLWAIRRISRIYYGAGGDKPVPADYDGNGTAAAAIFRPGTGMWVVRETSRFYFGSGTARPVPGDWNGDGTVNPALFQPASGGWAIREMTRVYFGQAADTAVPADYDGDGTTEAGIFRSSSALWAVRGAGRFYFGSNGDVPLPLCYNGSSQSEIAVFRPSAGAWAVKDVTRIYFGRLGDVPVTR